MFQFAVCSLTILLKFLFAPPRFGLVRTTGAKRSTSFHADLLFDDLMILSIMSVRRDMHETLADCRILFNLVVHGG